DRGAFRANRVLFVANREVDRNRQFRVRQVEVGDDRLRHRRVGDDGHAAAGHLEPRRSPVEVRDLAFDARVETDVVADTYLAGKGDEQPREEIGERFLQRESNG